VPYGLLHVVVDAVCEEGQPVGGGRVRDLLEDLPRQAGGQGPSGRQGLTALPAGVAEGVVLLTGCGR